MLKVIALCLCLFTISNMAATIDSLPDYSYCGYRSGGVKLPNLPAKATLYPNKSGDDTARIQAALDKVGTLPLDKEGRRGAVLLTKGIYRVSGSLKMFHDGVVLQGDGQSNKGTVIRATGTKKRALITIGILARKQISLINKKINIIGKKMPFNTQIVKVDTIEKLKVGDRVIVFYEPTVAWIEALGMNKITSSGKRKIRQWKTSGFIQKYDRGILKINNDQITLDGSLPENYDQKYFQPAYMKKYINDKRVKECGVENIRMVSDYRKGYENSDENHAWIGVKIANARNCWVKNVTAVHFGFGTVALEQWCQNITVQDSACLDPVSTVAGSRRYSFMIMGQMNLVQRCYGRRARHDFAGNWKARGLNVYLDCISFKPSNDCGPHACWVTGTLYDNVRTPGGALNVQDRAAMGSGHGWAGANEVFWNCIADSIKCDKPETTQNYAIGCIGRKLRGYTKKREFGHWESHGTPVKPRSLYLTQLKQRLGDKALADIAVDNQLDKFPLAHMKKFVIEPDNHVNMLLNHDFGLDKRGRLKYWRAGALGKNAKKNKPTLKTTTGPNGKSALQINHSTAKKLHIFQYMYLSESNGKCQAAFNFKALKGTKIAVSLSVRYYPKSGKEQRKAFTGSTVIADGSWQKYDHIIDIAKGITGKIVLTIIVSGQKISLSDAILYELTER